MKKQMTFKHHHEAPNMHPEFHDIIVDLATYDKTKNYINVTMQEPQTLPPTELKKVKTVVFVNKDPGLFMLITEAISTNSYNKKTGELTMIGTFGKIIELEMPPYKLKT